MDQLSGGSRYAELWGARSEVDYHTVLSDQHPLARELVAARLTTPLVPGTDYPRRLAVQEVGPVLVLRACACRFQRDDLTDGPALHEALGMGKRWVSSGYRAAR